MSAFKIEEVRIRLSEHPSGRVVGWASCVANGAVLLNNIAIVRKDDGGLDLQFPTMRSKSDHRHFHFNPISAEARAQLDAAILGKLAEVTR